MTRENITKIILCLAILLLMFGGGYWYFTAAPKIESFNLDPAKIAAAGLTQEPYRSPRANFEIHPPAGWTLDESGALGAFAVFVNPISDENENGAWNASLAITSEPATDLESFARESRQSLPRVLKDFRQTDNRRIRLSGAEGHLIGGDFTFDGLPLQTLRLLTYENGRGYAVTITTLASSWEKYALPIETALQTFKFLSAE